jgi:hypothetical protein
MGEYMKAASGQRLHIHVAIPGQQILNNSTIELQQWKRSDFYMVRADML